MICSKCGKENKDTAKFCAACGAKLKSSPGKKNHPRKPGRLLIAVVIIIALIVVAVAAVFAVRLVGDMQDKKKAEEVVSGFLDSYQACDPAASEFLTGTEDIAMNYEGISAFFADRLTYDIVSAEKASENLYTVRIEVETIDFEKAFTDSYQEAEEQVGEEKAATAFLDIMQSKLESSDCATKAISADVSVSNIDGTFRIQMDNSLANALSGGMNDYLLSLTGGEGE